MLQTYNYGCIIQCFIVPAVQNNGRLVAISTWFNGKMRIWAIGLHQVPTIF